MFLAVRLGKLGTFTFLSVYPLSVGARLPRPYTFQIALCLAGTAIGRSLLWVKSALDFIFGARLVWFFRLNNVIRRHHRAYGK